MKSGRAFWGTLFLAIGVLGLLNNFFSFTIDWGTAWKFWPLLLVLLGLAMFMRNSRNKWVIVAVIGLTAGVVIFTSMQKGCSAVDSIAEGDFGDWEFDHDSAHAMVTQEFATRPDTVIAEADFRFESGAGEFRVQAPGDDLFNALAESSVGSYEMKSERADGRQNVYLGLNDSRIHWKKGKHSNRVTMHFGVQPLWDMEFDIGAAKAEFDLRENRVSRLDIDAGAASVVVRIGSLADTTKINLDTGVSSIRITVPEQSSCEIRTDAALSSKHFEGFEKIGDGLYRSPSYGSGDRYVFIDIESGLSSLTVEREPGEGEF